MSRSARAADASDAARAAAARAGRTVRFRFLERTAGTEGTDGQRQALPFRESSPRAHFGTITDAGAARTCDQFVEQARLRTGAPPGTILAVIDDGAPPASLLQRLDLIRTHPGLYLGVVPPHFAAMLERLDTWIVGYSEAVRAHQVRDPGLEVYSSFWQFLEERLGRGMSEGTIPTIRLLSINDAEAWETYWRFLDEFRASAGA